MSIEVVIVTYNNAVHIGPCIASIVANGGTPLLVDNGSTDDTIAIARRTHSEIRIVPSGGNLGYGKAMNLGFNETTGEFVVLSNPDVEYTPNAILQMVQYLKDHPDVAIVGPQQIFPDGKWQRSYGDLPGLWPGVKDAIGINSIKNWARRCLWPYKLQRSPKDVQYVDGAVLVVRREAFAQLGGFDEKFLFYGEESDLCARAHKLGWRTVFNPEVTVMHVRGGSSAKAGPSERFMRLLIASQALLAATHLPRWKAIGYGWLQRIMFIRLALCYRVLSLVRPDGRFFQLVRVFDTYSTIWHEQMEDQLSHDLYGQRNVL